MDIKWKRYSHSMVTKVIVFIIAIVCFTSSITMLANIVGFKKVNLGIVFEDSYYLSNSYKQISYDIIGSLRDVKNYKSEDNILSGKTLFKDEILYEEEELFREFQDDSRKYNPNLTIDENKNIFKEVYADKLALIKDRLINRELNSYRLALQKLESYQGVEYYAKSGEAEFSSSTNKGKEYFKSLPAHMIFEGSNREVFPKQVNESSNYYMVTSSDSELLRPDIMYIAFTDEFLNPRIAEWEENKLVVKNSLYQIAGFLLVLLAAFTYLMLVIGRTAQKEQGVQLNAIDRLYNDIKIGMCFALIAMWIGLMSELYHSQIPEPTFAITLLIAMTGLALVLSLVKHIKNRTFMKHTLIYTVFHKLFKFIKDVYDSGSAGVKVVLIVIGYPLLVALTFFMFPITIGVAAWIALKKVKAFNAIKEGVKKVKSGDIHYTIDITGDGEFSQLASDINSITDGLNNAVENEIKSERLKTELITNVSHDIRTPLTSIITYVDLLKTETDQAKVKDYLEILDQKSQRLRILTEDLFEAAKASSGSMPVNFEKIDLESLITQGLGELDDKIQDRTLEFKISHPKEKVYIKADGKLLWRAIENLLANIFKYALEGSRVYVDIVDLGTEVTLIIKNISTYELNISSDELMERFKRGDESRSSQGSGLGLSIAKSLIEIQKGRFNIEIDGDLFKAIIHMRKVESN